MKQLLLTVLLSYAGIALQAQDHLPQTYSIAVGGGVTLPLVEGNRNEFFNKNGDRAGYDLMLEGRYYLTPYFALGAQYDYLRIADLPDKVHVHYVRPAATLRYLWSDGDKGAFFGFGIGYMNYQERTYRRGDRYGYLFQKGYFGLSFSMGYEFRITGKVSGIFRGDILMADWVNNPDARLYNPDGYDDGVNHNWFKSNITFFNLGFAIQFGR
ncbi:hypothetical protein [Bacteroides sp. UBA939]|uniref:hypothetical protein n=1 Tax=Bacteroides sp. UBA939 TaxID=1946092 RepID=UPI0039C888C0